MKNLILVAIVSIAAAGWAEADARELAPPEVEILSVIPRSPDVKPFTMSLPAEGRTEHAVTTVKQQPAAPPKNSPNRQPEQTAFAQEK